LIAIPRLVVKTAILRAAIPAERSRYLPGPISFQHPEVAMRIRGPSRLWAGAVALLALLTVGVAPSAAAAQPAGQESVSDVLTLHLVRLNCDDEAEHFSDEVELWINDQFVGFRGNMDGGDWWPLHPEIGWLFEGSIRVVFREDDGLVFIDRTITADDAFRGEIVETRWGPEITGWRYRFTFYVD
jgi:hypothetical protein